MDNIDLDVSNNMISEIVTESVTQPQLQLETVLDVSNNIISEIVTESVTQPQPQLQLETVLDISNNIISEIVTESVTQPQLQLQLGTDLDVSNNIISDTESVTQPQLQLGTDLDVSNNIISDTESVTQQQLQLGTDLDVSNNIISEIVTQPITQTDLDVSNNIILETVTQLQPQQLLQPIIQTVLDVSNNINTNINLKNSINVFDPNVKNIYRPKNSWGPVIWNFIHTISIIDFLDNEMYVNEVKKYLQSVFNILPCRHCCETYKIWIDKLDTIDINERMVLFKWSVDLHNEVNQKLNKETWSYEQAVEIWCNKLPELPLL